MHPRKSFSDHQQRALRYTELRGYTIPMFGNRHTLPYGKLLVTDGEHEQLCAIKEDCNGQYITFQRRRYRVWLKGDMYRPVFVIGEQIPRTHAKAWA